MDKKPYHHGNLRAVLIETDIQMVNKEDMLEAMKQYIMEKFVAILNAAIEE